MKWEDPYRISKTWHGGCTRHVTAKPTATEVAKLVKQWHSKCLSTHPFCKKSMVNCERVLPKRVVDVGGNDNTGIHLLDSTTKGLDSAYVALSHCWGQSRHLLLKRDNVESLKADIPWKDLPRTFQDAINVTRALGIRYIWIDSLCIIQDDKMDWEVEAEKMGALYSNASFVIAATASADGDGGLLSPDLHI